MNRRCLLAVLSLSVLLFTPEILFAQNPKETPIKSSLSTGSIDKVVPA